MKIKLKRYFFLLGFSALGLQGAETKTVFSCAANEWRSSDTGITVNKEKGETFKIIFYSENNTQFYIAKNTPIKMGSSIDNGVYRFSILSDNSSSIIIMNARTLEFTKADLDFIPIKEDRHLYSITSSGQCSRLEG